MDVLTFMLFYVIVMVCMHFYSGNVCFTCLGTMDAMFL